MEVTETVTSTYRRHTQMTPQTTMPTPSTTVNNAIMTYSILQSVTSITYIHIHIMQ